MTILDADGVRCHVLIDGARGVSPRFVFRGYDDAVQGPFVRPFLGADGMLPGRLAALLVESPAGPVLVDAGLGAYGDRVDAGRVPAELERIGVEPTDVRAVVLTHGHADHVGGLLLPDAAPRFANARHVIHSDEAAFWTSPEAAALPDDADVPARRAVHALRDAALLDEIDGDDDIAGSVRAILAPGHTPGHLAVLVGEALLWAGDAFVAMLNVPHPEWTSAADMDHERNMRTRNVLLARAATDDLLLAAAHMPVAGHVRRSAEGFTLEGTGTTSPPPG